MKKKIFSLVLVMLICMDMFMGKEAQDVQARTDLESAMIGDFYCSLLSDGTISIIEYDGSDEVLTIPSQLEGYIVSQVGDDECVFENNTVTKVIISSGIKCIQSGFFEHCNKLQTVVLPESVETIGEWAFSDCDKLENISIPASVNVIEDKAFENCTTLKTVSLLDGKLTTIGSQAFFNTAITDVTIPLSVTTISDKAFGFHAGHFGEAVRKDDFTIRGVFGSAAEKYAKANELTFIGTARASMPIIKPEFGTYYETQTVSFSNSSMDATIYYSITGNDKEANWIKYTEPFTINQTTDFIAYAEVEGCEKSAEIRGTIEILSKTKGVIACKSRFTKYVGDEFNLKARTNTDEWLKYKSSNKKVVSVSGEGWVKCKKKGSAKITIILPSSESSTGATKKVKVVVKKKLTVKQAKKKLIKYLKERNLWKLHNTLFYGYKDGKNYVFRYYIPIDPSIYGTQTARYTYYVNSVTGKITSH